MPPGGYGVPGQVAGPWLQYIDFSNQKPQPRTGIVMVNDAAFLSSSERTSTLDLFQQDVTLTLVWHHMTIALAASAWPVCLAAGSDGALWFTEPAGIGRLTNAYELREVRTAAPPGGIAAGPDGAMWFTEPSAHKIGRATSTGDPTEFTVPAQPASITAGPDGALWFTEPDVGRIGRMTTDGHVTEYNGAGTHPWGMAAAKDAVWFSDTVGAIGRIDLNGHITLTPIKDEVGGTPGGIVAVAPDGTVWFTQSPPASHFPGIAGKLGRIKVDGTVQLFSLPDTDKYFIDVAVDGGGRPWATTQTGGVWEYRV